MSTTILQRIHSLAETRPNDATLDTYQALESVLRQLRSSVKDAAAIAHAVTGFVMKLDAKDQERVIAAVESLGK